MEPYPEFVQKDEEPIPHFSGVDAFFNANDPSEWTPMTFAADPATTNFDAFLSGLKTIKSCERKGINAFAARCYRWLKNPENKVAVQEARGLMSAKVVKKQAYIASITAKDRLDAQLTHDLDMRSVPKRPSSVSVGGCMKHL